MLRLEGFGINFASILGPNLDPGGGPRRPFWTFLALLELSWGEDGPRMPQERFQDRFWSIFVASEHGKSLESIAFYSRFCKSAKNRQLRAETRFRTRKSSMLVPVWEPKPEKTVSGRVPKNRSIFGRVFFSEKNAKKSIRSGQIYNDWYLVQT